MSEVPNELKYTQDHEWVMIEENIAAIGITDHAQAELGDITFVELPEDDAEFHAGDEISNIESVKAASPVFSPLSGKVLEINADLEDEPGAINSDPYGTGWIIKLEFTDPSELDKLLDADGYESFLASEADE